MTEKRASSAPVPEGLAARHSSSGRRSSGAVSPLGEVVEDLAHDRRVEEEGDDPHLTAADGAGEGVDLVDPADELSP